MKLYDVPYSYSCSVQYPDDVILDNNFYYILLILSLEPVVEVCLGWKGFTSCSCVIEPFDL